MLNSLRVALTQCSAAWPVTWRQRLAGYVNFVRPCLKLPLEIVSAVRDGDCDACVAVIPYIRDEQALSFSDLCVCNDVHARQVFVDATPEQLGIVAPGSVPISVTLPWQMPIYLAEYVAALTALLTAEPGPLTLFTDNVGVLHNLHKGRCPRPWPPLLCRIFSAREFSIQYIPSDMNPTDASSRPFPVVP